jgi:hypothetical protein
MKNYDSIKKKLNDSKVELSDVLKRVAPDFADLSLDVRDVAKYSSDPLFISLLLFKLTKEREQTNQILERIESKFDNVMFELKSQEQTSSTRTHTEEQKNGEYNILAEQDEKIMAFIEQNGKATAQEIMHELGYKKQNAASQRLNLLFKQKILKKVRAGKKVFFVK